MGSIYDLGEAFYDLAEDQSAWSQETFGSDKERGPVPSLKHLEKEAREAQQKPFDAEEHADCFLLCLDSARRAGFSPALLIQAAELKMEKNKRRRWPSPHPTEPVEHVRSEDEAISPTLTLTKWHTKRAVYLGDELVYFGEMGYQFGVFAALGYAICFLDEVPTHGQTLEFYGRDSVNTGPWDPPESLATLKAQFAAWKARMKHERIAQLEDELRELAKAD